MKTILFQGDSITDGNREKCSDAFPGWGYPMFAQAELANKYVGEYRFLNRGCSGDQLLSVYNRMNTDIINLKPDYMTLLIGINDVWGLANNENGPSAESYEKIMSLMFEDILKKLPDLKVFIFEPFVLPGGFTEEKYDFFYSEVKARSEAVQRICEKFGFVFIPLQEKFEAVQKTTSDKRYYITDGVHPTPAGHYLIAKEFIKYFELNK